jgi:hypothetical protein
MAAVFFAAKRIVSVGHVAELKVSPLHQTRLSQLSNIGHAVTGFVQIYA